MTVIDSFTESVREKLSEFSPEITRDEKKKETKISVSKHKDKVRFGTTVIVPDQDVLLGNLDILGTKLNLTEVEFPAMVSAALIYRLNSYAIKYRANSTD